MGEGLKWAFAAARRTRQKPRFSFKIVQDGLTVAAGSGDDMEAVGNEAMRYAFQYSEEGEVVLKCEGFSIDRPLVKPRREK